MALAVLVFTSSSVIMLLDRVLAEVLQPVHRIQSWTVDSHVGLQVLAD